MKLFRALFLFLAMMAPTVVLADALPPEVESVDGSRTFADAAQMSRDTTTMLRQLAAIRQGVRALYGGQASYRGVSTQLIVEVRLENIGLLSLDGRLVNVFGGNVNVSAADTDYGPNGGFMVEFEGVPPFACTRLASSDLGRGTYSTSVGMQIRTQIESDAFFDESAAAAACSAPENTVRWVFN